MKFYFCILFIVDSCFCLLLVLALIGATSANKQECDAWADLARDMTGNGHTQMCDNHQTSKCTRVDCEGTFRARPSFGSVELEPIVLDYCFGNQINPCSTPPSMNFYIALPEKNFSKIFTVQHNDKVPLTSLQLPFGSFGQVSPVFVFGLDKQPNGYIAFSVTLKVKAELKNFGTSIYIPRLERTVINATVPAETCPKSQNVTKPFQTGSCHAQKYPATPEPTNKPAVIPVYKPSATLDKACDLVTKPCSHGEICDQGLPAPLCKCGTDFHLSPKKDACLTYSSIGQSCRSQFDCGYNEKCESTGSKGLTCQCSDGYQYCPERELCIISGHEKDVATAATNHSDGGNKDKHKSDHSAKAGINKFIIIGASIGAVFLILLAVTGFVCYRRRRNVFHVNLNESDQPLISNLGDDDDMNIIM